MNSIPNDMLYSAKELVLIIKACGEAGVVEFPMNGGVMKLTPRWVSEAQTAISYQTPEQLTLVPHNEDEDPIMSALEDPLQWQRDGMNPEVNDVE